MENLHRAKQPEDFSTLYAADILSKLFNKCPDREILKLYAESLCSRLDETIYRYQSNLRYGSVVLFLSANDFEIRSFKRMFSFYDIDMRFATSKKHLADLAKINFSSVFISDAFDLAPSAVAKRLKRLTLKGTKFVYLTMKENPGYKKIGFDACLVHPVDSEDLNQVLNKFK